jgi:hypothetical protein
MMHGQRNIRFITMFTTARHLSPSWARSMQPTLLTDFFGGQFLYYVPIYVEFFQVVTYHLNHLSLTEYNRTGTKKLPIWS